MDERAELGARHARPDRAGTANLTKLGDRPLASLRRSHVEEWAKALSLAPSSARMVYETLSSMLAAAVDDERIPKNPAKGARLAKIDAAPLVPLTAAECRAIAHAAADHVRAGVLVQPVPVCARASSSA